MNYFFWISLLGLLTGTALAQTPPSAKAQPSPIRPQTVTFASGGEKIAAHLFLPPGQRAGERRPAVVVLGPFTQVKEQLADLYASRLAAQGLVALSFDPRNWGQSGGQPRYYESVGKEEDIRAAVAFLNGRPEVAAGRVGGLGVCFGAGYMAEVVAQPNTPLAAFATVAAWLHDRESLTQLFGADEVVRRLKVGAEAQQQYQQTGKISYVPAYAPGTNPEAAMNFKGGYYADAARGAVPQWVNQYATLSWQDWMALGGVAAAAHSKVPTLFVHSNDSSYPDNVRRAYAALTGPKELFWTEGQHFDFYDREPQVTRAANAVGSFFTERLKTSSLAGR